SSPPSPLSRYIRPTKGETVETLASVGKPVVILLDEFVIYLAKIGEEKARQELANLHTFMEAVKSTDRCLLVVTSPPGSAAYEKEATQLEALIQEKKWDDAAAGFVTVVDRVSAPVVPVEAEDFFAICKKRLVEHIDEYTAKNMEQHMGRLVTGLDFNDCYPFHPLLREVLYNRASLFPNFQKTRDSLKVVALAVKAVMNDPDHANSYFISPAEIPLWDPDAKGILTNEKVFGLNLEQAVTKDVVHNAREMDEKKPNGTFARMATAVFMYSLHPDAQKRGALPADVFRCMVPELMSIEDAKQRLEKLQESSDHMWYEGGRFVFKPQENVPNMIRRKANSIMDAEAIQHIQSTVYSTVFKEGRCEFFSGTSFFSPSPNKINVLVVMPWENADDAANAALSIHCERKNTAVVLVPSKELWGILLFNAKRVLAAERVLKEIKGDKEALNEAKKLKDKYETDAVQTMRTMYGEMRYLWGTDVKRETFDPTNGNTIADAILKVLRRKQKLADPSITDPTKYIDHLMGTMESVEVRTLFKNAEVITNVPFAFKEDLLKILSAGVREGVVGAVEGRLPEQLSEFVRCHFRENYQVQEGDTIVAPTKAEQILNELKRKKDQKTDKGGGDGGNGAGIGGGTGGTDREDTTAGTETETLDADIKDLFKEFDAKITELMLQRVEYELEIDFTGNISGKITAKTNEERAAMRNLVDALSKAAVLLPAVKVTVKITKRVA
ncbi:MAG: DUF499 domain-containing protein, partial [Candidatus Methanosuratincola sp.]